ncbi:MAG: hypothetical protein A3G18_06215 [Rhodospirillales bacterium RIFCSPLOWO2_12_FULL_58_28]|nr:MAG: hypothetical protein A3H92_03480 [Rhodospirillales bacterium RIFCSPLOWO2_02_FULL_58_16]OHC76778.1 MAG: hypothetical protein A3G18_06215 [Rhodospirillales bacterium RIFCSPLOWO2_12_FULL_58_28]
MLSEFLNLNIFSFLLIFARVGTSLMILPGFSSPVVNPQARIFVALGVSLVLTPILSADLPAAPPSALGLLALLVGEIIIGAFLGTIGVILVSALQIAGTIIALVSSLANAMIQDPIAEQQSSVVSNLITTIGVLLIFSTNMHHLMLSALSDSYTIFAPGKPLPIDDFTEFLSRQVAASFALGVQLSAPAMISGLVYYVGVGLLGRLMPMLPLFMFAMPFQIAAQLWVVMIAMSSIMMVFLAHFNEGFSAFLVK